jgi:hypothetical protein
MAYSHGEKDCVALGCGNSNVYLHRLDSGEQVGVLHMDDEVKMVCSMAASKLGPTHNLGVTGLTPRCSLRDLKTALFVYGTWSEHVASLACIRYVRGHEGSPSHLDFAI